MVLMVGAASLTFRWAIADYKRSLHLRAKEKYLPGWLVFLPLCISAIGFLFLGLSMLIKEPYWEHIGLLIGQILLIFCCFFGAWLIIMSFIWKRNVFGVAGVLGAIGLLLMGFLLLFPAFFINADKGLYPLASYLWFGMLLCSIGFLMASILLTFPYNFVRFPLGIAILYSFGLGLMEISYGSSSFQNLLYVWDFRLGFNYVDIHKYGASIGWRIAGMIKIVLAVGVTVAFYITLRYRKSKNKKLL